MQIGPQRPESMIGQVIADYELTEYIGAGATGVVFRGRRKATAPNPVEKTGLEALDFPEEAAIKLLAPPLGATDAELAVFQQRFVREARTLKKLDHPNILRLIDYGQDAHSGYFYMVLRYMAGGSLASAIVNRGPLPLAEASSILAQIGGALDYAHGEGVVHRDVKPGNILLDADGTPYLSDFSIVRLLAETATLRTSTGHMMGTPAYMAPEQFGDSSRVGPAADIYGLGMVAYEMVTGHAAFGATNWAQVMLQQLQETPASPSEARPDLPKPAEAAIMQALAKDPAERFARAAAFANAFTQGLEGRWVEGLTRFVSSSARRTNGASSAQTIPERTTPEPPHRRSRMGVLGAAVALLLVVACMAALALPSARGALLAGLALGATATATSDQGGASSTQTTAPGATHAPGAKPTATAKKGSGGGVVIVGGGGGGATTGPTAAPTAKPTPGPPVAIYGDGSDGALTISSNIIDDSLDAACSGSAGSTTLIFTSASSSFSGMSGKPVLIHQSQGSGAGEWMRDQIITASGTSSGTLTLRTPLNANYTTGAQVIVLRQYTSVTVKAGVIWTARAWNGRIGGILAFVADGTVTILGTISADGRGFRGGSNIVGSHTLDPNVGGVEGEGTTGAGTGVRSTSPNGNGGGGGGSYDTNPNGTAGPRGGGAGGGNSTSGTNGQSYAVGNGGTGGGASGTSSLTLFTFGGGGGAGGNGHDYYLDGYGNDIGGDGGNGGGAIALFAASLVDNGTITANGGTPPNILAYAYNGSGDGRGGGGGAGGSILLRTYTAVSGSGAITAYGAKGGTAEYPTGTQSGGNGADGRIYAA